MQRIAVLGATLAVSYYRGVSEEAMLLERDQQRDAQIDRAILALVRTNWMKIAMVMFSGTAILSSAGGLNVSASATINCGANFLMDCA